MLNRFKLVFLLPVLTALGILFVQNRQPLALKVLCPDIDRSCWYQSSELPLAVWMALFLLGGIISSLVWQLLNRFSSPASSKKRYSPATRDYESSSRSAAEGRSRANKRKIDLDKDDSDWESREEDGDWNSQVKAAVSSDYEVRREPENVQRSGSTYSYKFREASERDAQDANVEVRNSDRDRNKDTDSNNEEDWI